MKNVLLILIAFTLVACNNDDDTTTEPAVQMGPIAFINVNQNYLRVPGPVPIIQPSNLVIDNLVDWNNLLGQISPEMSPNALNEIAQVLIDFNQTTVIMVIRQSFPHIEFVEITGVMENANDIEVTTQDSNFNGGFLAPSQPYHIIMIPKTTKPIVFL